MVERIQRRNALGPIGAMVNPLFTSGSVHVATGRASRSKRTACTTAEGRSLPRARKPVRGASPGARGGSGVVAVMVAVAVAVVAAVAVAVAVAVAGAGATTATGALDAPTQPAIVAADTTT